MPNLDAKITIRDVKPHELLQIASIDRSEEIYEQYQLIEGVLTRVPFRVSVTAFDPNELDELISHQKKIIEVGGAVLGAWDGAKLVGVVSVENLPRGVDDQYRKMDILYVSKAFRSKGIGRELVEQSKRMARLFGGQKLYISATPTQSTVDFYLNLGATLTNQIVQELFDMEPLDIHLELDLN